MNTPGHAVLNLAVLGRRGAEWPRVRIVAASMLLHVAVDLPLHGEDAHRHFYPLSDWRFVSPVSYWDPARYGRIVAPFELLLVAILSALIYRRVRTPAGRVALILANLLYLAGFAGFYVAA